MLHPTLRANPLPVTQFHVLLDEMTTAACLAAWEEPINLYDSPSIPSSLVLQLTC